MIRTSSACILPVELPTPITASSMGTKGTTTRQLLTSPRPFGSTRRTRWRIAAGRGPTTTGSVDKAIADWNEVLRLNPKDAVACFHRGLTYWNKGENDKSIADLTEAIRLDPKNGDSYYLRGLGYGKKGENDKAITDFTEAIRHSPKDVPPYILLAWRILPGQRQ